MRMLVGRMGMTMSMPIGGVRTRCLMSMGRSRSKCTLLGEFGTGFFPSPVRLLQIPIAMLGFVLFLLFLAIRLSAETGEKYFIIEEKYSSGRC